MTRLGCFGLLPDRSNPKQGWMSGIVHLALELVSQGHEFPKETVLSPQSCRGGNDLCSRSNKHVSVTKK